MASKKVNISGINRSAAKIISDTDLKSGLNPNTLKNKVIGISVSESDEFRELGFSEVHQKDITIELVRYLIINGAHITYGGDFRDKGYTKLFSELTFQYRDKADPDKRYFTNYFGWPIYNQLKNSDLAEFKRNRVDIVRCFPASGIPLKLKNENIDYSTLENRRYWAASMSNMREEMAGKTDARVFIGGKLSEYKGFYPGIIEECILTLRKRKKQPIFLLGAFGGATMRIIRAIKGEAEKVLADEVLNWNPDSGQIYKSAARKNLRQDLTDIFREFKKMGVTGLGKRNGLTIKQNEILFETPHFHEMIYYILLGLKKKL